MTERLNWTELRRAVMARTGATEREAHAFLDAFMEQLKEALRTDKQAKIIGLGTFRLQSVAPRKSVSVITGEPITIKEYNKIVFSPEIGIKELIDNSRSEPDTEEFNPIRKLGQQADEIIDILADLGQDPRTKVAPVSAPAVSDESVTPDVPVPTAPLTEQQEEQQEERKEKPTVSETVSETASETPSVIVSSVSDTATPTPPISVEPAKDDSPAVVPTKPQSADSPKPTKKRKYHFLRDTLICTICLLLLLLGGYFFLREQLSQWVDSLSEKRLQPIEVVDTVANHCQTDMQALPTNDSAAIEPLCDTLNTPMSSEIAAPVYTDFIATEKLREGSRLSWLAYRYYGNKDLWVFIYDANKEHLDNPNQIRVGTTIRIPRLTSEQTDTTNLQTKALIESLRAAANSRIP